MSPVRHTRTADDRPGERGSILIMVLVIMILSMTLIAALLVHSRASLTTERDYKARTERSGRSEDAMAFLIASIRRPPNLISSLGTIESRADLVGCASGCGANDGAPFTRTFKTVTVTCQAVAGSGAVKTNGTYADRTVSCRTSEAGTGVTYNFKVRFVDQSGTNLGQSVQVLDSDFGDS